jgi:hypothetical protein
LLPRRPGIPPPLSFSKRRRSLALFYLRFFFCFGGTSLSAFFLLFFFIGESASPVASAKRGLPHVAGRAGPAVVCSWVRLEPAPKTTGFESLFYLKGCHSDWLG